MEIRKLSGNEPLPIKLLLLADPSEKIIESYAVRGTCFVAAENAEIFGAYILLPTRPQTVELVNVAVSADKQGKGIGKQLVHHAVASAKSFGFQTIEVGTGNSSIGQLALYQKCGFRITGVDTDFFLRHYKEEIFEHGIQTVDMLRLSQDLSPPL